MLNLEEAPLLPSAVAEELQDDGFQLNLDDLSLDADWDLASPFAAAVSNKKAASVQADSDSSLSKPSGAFDLTGERDALSPFAESMLVEETSDEGWLQEELDENFAKQAPVGSHVVLRDLDQLTESRDNLAKLNQALAYIEQGSVDSACSILNEVISNGDAQQKQEARELLAKIA